MFEQILKNHVKQVRGIFQVGANTGQEMPIFTQFTNNIVLVEPIKHIASYLKNTYPNYIVVPYAMGSVTETRKIYCASNNNESSSLLKPAFHTNMYPHITFSDGPEIQVKTFDDINKEFNINLENYNVLVTDTQGFDLEVIKGFSHNINYFDLILCEYMNVNYYENNSNLDSIVNYLTNNFNFKFEGVFGNDQYSGNGIFTKNR